MSDLQRELRDLGARVEYPPTPDIAGGVRARLEAEPRPRIPFARRRALVLALAALLVAVGAVMAVPQARTAILELLGLRGVTIERVPEQPEVPPGADLALGERVTLEEARERAGFDVLVPVDEPPDDVYFSRDVVGGRVSFVYGSTDRVDLLLTQFEASFEDRFIRKTAGPGTTIEDVTVNGGRGFWISGEMHVFLYLDANGSPREDTRRLAGNVLLWEQGPVTVRLEGAETRDDALGFARSLR